MTSIRELTDFEKEILLSIKSYLMDSDGHDKTNLQEECLSEIEAIRIINKALGGEK